MPRQPRLDLAGHFYHVIVRGIERCAIFRDVWDRRDFLRRFGDGLAKTGSRCFAWALMTNHLHLLLLSGPKGLVSLMHPLLTGYAVTFNSKYRRAGHLFQNRYKAILCQEDPYFLELVRYIGLQPVRAGLIQTPEALALYPWTSHSALMGGPTPPWLDVENVLARFGSLPEAARASYERFMIDGWNQGHRDDLEGGGLLRSHGGMAGLIAMRRAGQQELADVRILGDGHFVEDILRQADAEQLKGRKMQALWTPAELEQSVAELLSVEPDALHSKDHRRPVADARALLIYAAREWLAMSGATLGRWLGLSSGAVSKAFQRGHRLSNERDLKTHLRRKKRSNVP